MALPLSQSRRARRRLPPDDRSSRFSFVTKTPQLYSCVSGRQQQRRERVGRTSALEDALPRTLAAMI
jgi:hypothetical protein